MLFRVVMSCILVFVTAHVAAEAKVTNCAKLGSENLDLLFRESDAAYLARNPIQRLRRNSADRTPHFGDMISDAWLDAERSAAEAEAAALKQIDRATLDPVRQVSYDMFAWNKALALEGATPAIRYITDVQPLDHFFGWQVIMPQLSSGAGAAPFATAQDYEDNLRRLDEYALYLDRMVQRLREGLRRDLTQPKRVAETVLKQFAAEVVDDPKASSFYKPLQSFPAAVPDADRRRLEGAYQAFLRDRLIPAHRQVRDVLKSEYLPRARESVGLGALPGGDALYRHLIHRQTTTTISPEDAHRLGISEVARISAAMEEAKRGTGFSGNLAEFSAFLTREPRFQPASAEEMHEAFRAIDVRMTGVVERAFSVLPKTPLDLQPTPAYRAATSAFGEYARGSPDGSRSGIFYFNTHALPTRFTWVYETLYLHEAVPGHHFQASLAMENAALPNFQRFEGPSAFSEGWALYAESLGPELGFYTDPYQHFGHLADEMLRAMRLVVDTGIHAKGWSRERAIAYMLAHSAMSRNEVEFEVDRYIAMPAQALSYKVGQITIRRLRDKAEKALGTRFDLRRFHNEVLSSGRISLAVLEAKMDRWIATQAE